MPIEIVGNKGEKGDVGAHGAPGEQGSTGTVGQKGAKGARADRVSITGIRPGLTYLNILILCCSTFLPLIKVIMEVAK